MYMCRNAFISIHSQVCRCVSVRDRIIGFHVPVPLQQVSSSIYSHVKRVGKLCPPCNLNWETFSVVHDCLAPPALVAVTRDWSHWISRV